MKKIIQIMLLVLFASITQFAQIPNAGFENWTQNGQNGYDPDGWTTLDVLWDATQQSTDSYSGSYAAKLERISFSTAVVPPILQAFFPATQNYGSLTGYYKFLPHRQSDVLSIDVILFKGSSIFGVVGSSTKWETNAAQSSYTRFTVPIEYFVSGTPDSAWVIISIDDTSDNEQAGAYALFDDFSWGPVTAVQGNDNNIPREFKLNQNYPNPFNPNTTISFVIGNLSFVTLKIYDDLGREVTTLMNEEKPAGEYKVRFDANVLPSGVYYYRIQAGKYSETKKMILLR